MKKRYYNKILSSLEICKTFKELKQIHGVMIITSAIRYIIPLSKLIDFCTNSEPQNLDYAESVFVRIDRPSVYIWNSMIKGHSNTKNPAGALVMYKKMQRLGYSPDHFTFPFVLKACAAIVDVRVGKCVHNRVLKTGFESDLYANTSLIHMYVCCADLESGEKLFDESPKWNVVGWATMIAGYVNNDRASDAIRVFKEMEFQGVEPNEITIVNVLVACAHCRDLETGKWVHDCIGQLGFCSRRLNSSSNVILDTAILEMYAKCGSLKVARAYFNEMPERNIVAWNSMIGAYNQYGQASEAFRLFEEMRLSGLEPDEATMLSLLSACAKLGALSLGQGLHAYVEKTNIAEHVSVQTSVMDMYAKTGDRQSAFQIFSGLHRKDVKAWTSMIMGLAMHGHGKEALNMFSQMQRDESVSPDHITYLGVLSACSHAGLVDEGYKHFNSMSDVYGLVPMEEHYGCMVDILSRAGKLMEAECLVKTMPINPSVAVWGSLLNGCEIHDNVDLAEQIENHITKLKPQGSGIYVLLANIYAKAGRWQGVKRVRDLMRHNGFRRTYGWSSIEPKLLSS
ncbi:Pentatricopeptide repeat-containing protein [Thalictrum thalictroides]|uniref:Pentatricopeptide repeat-containing protein n=1 Tax=Thalictrum thalictroides TaxID=46969 RepID=A0A7J6V1T5_THATH|nr:Pentatricopeptide repeat-containing protein [Thalictrum thalictroides]